MNKPIFLSKSRLMSARQCLRRVHLEIRQPELMQISAETAAAFRKGNEIGDIARRIYGGADSNFIPYEGSFSDKFKATRRYLSAAERRPLFEGTLQYNGVTVRADVLLPDGEGWRLIEVKSSTSVKVEHAFDCAIQSWVFTHCGFELTSVSLAHVDNRFVYQGDGDYGGLLVEVPVDDDVEALLPSVAEWVAEARKAAAGDEPDVAVGGHCFSPYECPFIQHCWPGDTDYPLLGFGGGVRKEVLGELVAEGIVDVRDAPDERLNDTQRRIRDVTRRGVAEQLPAASVFLNELRYPRYYLDFETVGSAIPLWQDTRPYQQLPFQWSCHLEAADGELQHADFLDLSSDAPMRRFTESLIRVLGNSGPILVYSSFEKTCINECGERFPDLLPALEKIKLRLVDLLPLTRQNYYHPAMQGSWSIKSVLPTIAPDLDYAALEGIQDGMAASEAYLEAISPETPAERRQEIRRQLLAYCQYDTLALVRLVRFLGNSDHRR